MTKKRALGRGLDALIPTSRRTCQHRASEGGVRGLRLTTIAPNPHQPRQHFDPEALDELAASIKEHGLIQPLIVSEVAGDAAARHRVPADRRRTPAGSRQAGRAGHRTGDRQRSHASSRCSSWPWSRTSSAPISTRWKRPPPTSNLARTLASRSKRSPTRWARTASRSPTRCGCLRLPDFCKSMLASGQISEGHARALLGLEDDHEMMQTGAQDGDQAAPQRAPDRRTGPPPAHSAGLAQGTRAPSRQRRAPWKKSFPGPGDQGQPDRAAKRAAG